MAHFEPLTLLSALAAVTERIGLVATASTTYNEPYHVARKFASLDHISGGRAGWNIVTSADRRRGAEFRPRRAARRTPTATTAPREFVEVVTALWDSWEDDAFVARQGSPAATSIPTSCTSSTTRASTSRSAGRSTSPRSPQGRPVLVQAGSSETGKDFAAATAEVVFTAHQTLDDAQAFYARRQGPARRATAATRTS